MDKITLYVEKSEPYCLFLDFVDMEEFLAFKSLCTVSTVPGHEDCSMLCVSNISIKLKRMINYASTFQVPVRELAKLNLTASEIGSVRYELDGQSEHFESIISTRK